jgi:hypothetical protein
MVSTTHESQLVVTSFQLSVSRRFRPVLSTEHLWMGLSFYPQFSAVSGRLAALVLLPFGQAQSALACRKLRWLLTYI